MADWISKKESENARKKKAGEEYVKQTREKSQIEDDSYVRNKGKVDSIYDNVESLVKRAVAAGVDVSYSRNGKSFTLKSGWMSISIVPYGERLSVLSYDYRNVRRDTQIAFRLAEKNVSSWIQWLATNGASGFGPGGRVFGSGSGLGIVLVVLAIAIVIVGLLLCSRC